MARARNHVFLNIPYDDRFRDLYVAYIAGLTAFGFVPRATLEIPSGERRLDRILSLIRLCRYSFHDLSRVELDENPPPTPRFNMPFELGLLLGWRAASRVKHDWFVFEEQRRRLQKSLSDLNGTDEHVHDGTPEGVLREICNVFAMDRRLTVRRLLQHFVRVEELARAIQREQMARDVFQAAVFSHLVAGSRDLASRLLR